MADRVLGARYVKVERAVAVVLEEEAGVPARRTGCCRLNAIYLQTT